MMLPVNRRRFLRTAGGGLGLALGGEVSQALGPVEPARAQEAGARPARPPTGVAVINPRDRVPLGLIVDDSTCLVNLAHFCIPQFHEVFPDQYRQPWKTLPREIPDAFLRRFGEWCGAGGIKGKFSLIPYPACVGWLDRELPGWSKEELTGSLDLVRALLVPNWDIHPEMVSHTWVVDPKTGRPFPERSAAFMENWGWSEGKSADQLAAYMSYALGILKNVGMTCAGITTPGGFGIRALPELAQGTLEACRDVFKAEIPHYFRHSYTDSRSVAPRVELASGLDGPDPKCVVSVIGCTGDWFGGWDGLSPGSVDRFITADLKAGRLADVITRGEPAVMVCHWPGLYFNGREVGFRILQKVVERLHTGFHNLIWMNLSELARYWAARELTRIERAGPRGLSLKAPFACPRFTLKVELDSAIAARPTTGIRISREGSIMPLAAVGSSRQLASGTFYRKDRTLFVCIDLPKGRSRLELGMPD
jgi:hypothetical protein